MRGSRSQSREITFGLSYVPLIGAGPAVDPYLRMNMSRDLASNLKKRPCSSLVRGPGHNPPPARPSTVGAPHLSFSRDLRFPVNEETFPRNHKAPERASRTSSTTPTRRNAYRSHDQTRGANHAFTQSSRFNGIRESGFCLGDHMLKFSSLEDDRRSWQRGFHMDKVQLIFEISSNE
jgi:hypothetical protein